MVSLNMEFPLSSFTSDRKDITFLVPWGNMIGEHSVHRAEPGYLSSSLSSQAEAGAAFLVLKRVVCWVVLVKLWGISDPAPGLAYRKGEGIEAEPEGGLHGGRSCFLCWLCFPALAGNGGFSFQSVLGVALRTEAREQEADRPQMFYLGLGF